MAMIEPISAIETDHTRAIAHLCEQLCLPEAAVSQVFAREFERLATGARIATYIPILAMNNTRSILHKDGRRASQR